MSKHLRRAAASGESWARRCGLFLAAAVLVSSSARAADPVIDNKGFTPNRDLESQLPFEHVDPMTGNLLLTFTDLELPGNGGFDLRVQRTYNSKIWGSYSSSAEPTLGDVREDSWAGIGWTLHFGRVLRPKAGPSTLITAGPPGPVIEMPDGSRHQSYPHFDPGTASADHFITRDYWTYERPTTGAPKLRHPNGVVYTFGRSVFFGEEVLYATEIADAFGNRVVIKYPTSIFAPPDAIESVEQQLATGQVRLLTFTYVETLIEPGSGQPREARALASMTYKAGTSAARTWSFVQRLPLSVSTHTFLDEVVPPLGPPWRFEYWETGDSLFMLRKLTTPGQGVIDYEYFPMAFQAGSGVVYSPVLSKRVVSGEKLSTGTWTYLFQSPSPSAPIVSLVTSACGKTRYTTREIGPLGDEDPWAIGTIKKKEVLDLSGVVLQTEEWVWRKSVPISEADETAATASRTHVPLVESHTLTRGGKTYEIEYTYDDLAYSKSRGNNFNDHGRAREILETGESGALTRKTTRTFFYGSSTDPSFGTYMVDKPASETVRVPAGGSESFTNTYEYETGGGYRGFLKAQTIRGITTEYTPELLAGKPNGNVKTAKDGNGNVTSFAYAWGRTQQITTPLHTITRVINPDGTMASEKRRGFTTSFVYDPLQRETQRTPPAGNQTFTTYDNDTGRQVMVTRGTGAQLSRVTTDLDGLGRVIGTANNLILAVKTATSYDACGRATFQSYPFSGPTGLAKGASFSYDSLGRLLERTEPNDSSGDDEISYAYGPGLKVTVTDEKGNQTEQNWVAFGDPSDARLASVKDADDKTTVYAYNTLGSLLSVTPPTGPGRSWTYYASEAGGKPGLPKSETHPENGTVSYSYDGVGNVKDRTDARGTTTYAYDGNNRLKEVARPDGYLLRLGYDESDNRTLLENLMPGGVSVKSTFAYDAANRQTQRKDELKIKPPKVQVFTTTYAWDAHDRPDTLTYPSSTAAAPRKAKYTYDVAGRILSVANPGKKTYADLFTYHPTGAVASFRAGSGKIRSFEYTRRNRLKSVSASPTLQLQYDYEPNGNVHSIDDSRPGFDQTFGYDSLDRLILSTSPTSALAGNFVYDSRGNRKSSTLGGPATFAYHGATDRLESVNRAGVIESFGHDGYGNLVNRQVGSDPAEVFSYTPDHMLEAATASGLTTRYRYDGDGSRVAKEEAGGGLRFYLHGPGGQILSELRECPASIEPVRDSIQAGGKLIAFVKPSPPIVSMLAASASATEQPGGTITLTVRITTVSGCPSAEPVTLSYSTINGTALAGADYTTTAGSLTFPPGTSSGSVQTVTIPLVNDTLVEPNETFSFKLSSPEGGVLGTPNAATVTVVDNDTPKIGWVPFAVSALESSGSVTLTARITTAEGNPLPASVSALYATANGTAVTPKDYLAQSGVLAFAAGLPSGSEQSVTVPVLKDGLVEKDETFKVVLGTPTGATVGAPATATVTLLDVSPQLAFSAATFSGGEGASAAVSVVLVTPDGQPILAPVTVKCATASLTAKAGVDYTTTTATLTFPAGAPTGSLQTAIVPLREDALSEGGETLKVTLSAAKGGRLGTPNAATVTILDNDPLPVVSISDASLLEPNSGSKPMSFAVRLSAPAGRVVSVGFATTPMSAQAGSDFTAKTGTVTFAAGTISRTVAISVIGDTVDEENEAFLVSLTGPVNVELGRAVAQGSILDNDGQPSFCQLIAIVPYTITTSGRYCLAGDLAFHEASGSAIMVEADFVRLDLEGYRLDGSGAGPQTQAVGVHAFDRTGLVVRNGRIQGFRSGVELSASGFEASSGRHLVEGIEAEGNTLAGIFVVGRNSTVRRSKVLFTGGIPLEEEESVEAGEDTYGIALLGPGARALHNDVRGTEGNGSGVGRGLLLETANGGLALGNYLGQASGTTTGLLIRASKDVIILKNRFIGLSEGLVFDFPSTGVYRGNFSTGVTFPYQGGTDAGGNH